MNYFKIVGFWGFGEVARAGVGEHQRCRDLIGDGDGVGVDVDRLDVSQSVRGRDGARFVGYGRRGGGGGGSEALV